VSFESLIGAAAAFCTTISYVPQLKKCWTTGQADDLSLKMLLLLAMGLSLWIAYGVLRSDLVIVAANAVSLTLLTCILCCKLRG
jgi:MtN3 and saliva related transmembrane protein